MANPEHLKVLKQGVEVWNRWREEQKKKNLQDLGSKLLQDPNLLRSRLTDLDLSGANLSMENLSWANLASVNLSGTNLSGTDLTLANLSLANLARANLVEAKIWLTEFTGTDLSESNLSRADLCGVIFRFTNLKGVDFNSLKLIETSFINTDLQLSKNLATVKHAGRSFIDINTIYNSQGKIPESFLRGCGIPENFIQYMSPLTCKAFDFYSCFISYSSKDQDFADRLYSDLQSKEVRCWFAPEDMRIGEKIRDRIDRSIRIHDKLLLVMSEYSINSDWVEDEVEAAYEQERVRGKTVLFPIRLDDAVMNTDKSWAAKLRRARHIGDFKKWKDHDAYQKAFDRLLRDLKAEKPKKH
jgi:hypothetical protein